MLTAALAGCNRNNIPVDPGATPAPDQATPNPGEATPEATPTIDPMAALNMWLNKAQIDKDIIRVLLIGYDEKEDTQWARNDTTMILQIDTVNNEMKLVSFMRDMWVNIPGHGPARLNEAAYRGGPALAIRTVKEVFGVPIDYYAAVTFETFTQVMRIVGEIKVNVQESETEHVSKLESAVSIDGEPMIGQGVVNPGENTFNEYQAASYVRDRHSMRRLEDGTIVYNDLGRNERQRTVIKAAWDKVKSFPLVAIPASASLASVYVDTDMPLDMVIALLMQMMQNNATMQDMAIPLNGRYWSEYHDEETGTEYTETQMQAWVQQLKDEYALELAAWQAAQGSTGEGEGEGGEGGASGEASDPPVYRGPNTVDELCYQRGMQMVIGWNSSKCVAALHEFLGMN